MKSDWTLSAYEAVATYLKPLPIPNSQSTECYAFNTLLVINTLPGINTKLRSIIILSREKNLGDCFTSFAVKFYLHDCKLV